MPVPEKILQLVERFDANIADYKSSSYNETQTRREFIDPFFMALGWDVDNSQGKPESQKEVIHEAKVLVEDAQKAPDYCFRLSKDQKFFVEAKKPSVSLKDNIHPAYQLRRYGWSASLPISILTDFEEFAVYDCRIMPEKNDKATHSRLMYLTYADYATKWDELSALFSRNAIAGGSLEQFADARKDKRGVLPVDVAFLQDIERWRDQLARHLAQNHPALTRRDLNYAVQRTIDRIIFLRICEDRGIEPRGKLQTLQNQSNVYGLLLKRFYDADAKYNSGIFHFNKERDHQEDPDTLTPTLSIDDDLLKGILKRLYYPDSPYAFDVIPTEILGQVYEQFLGKVICLDSSHQATVEEKPEVKKAGGVYYTPAYIVDYIVAQTVGELFKNKTPKQAETLTILDPACGSGSFLLGAYDYLLDWYLDRYLADDPKKWSKSKPPRLRQLGDEWGLTIGERKRILLAHIYGVDIDDQAVEVTKLSLLLKVLEGEDDQSLSSQMVMFHERVLPNLAKNIKWGNSLISHDFYIGKQQSFDEEEMIRVNAFDWKKEFPVMQNGGFDVVIGNPPYGYMIPPNQQEYFSASYHHQDYQKDLYLLFLERYDYLLKPDGLLGVIISNTWLQSLTFTQIRKYLTSAYRWLKILHLPEKVFKAVVDTHVIIFQHTNDEQKKSNAVSIEVRKGTSIFSSHMLSWQNIPKNGEPINIIASERGHTLFHKITKYSTPLMKICEVYNGIKPDEREAVCSRGITAGFCMDAIIKGKFDSPVSESMGS